MKILLGVPEFPPYHIGWWGVVFEALAKEYVKLWHQVLVVYGYYPTKTGFETIKQYHKNGINFVQVPLLPTPMFLPFLKTVLPTAPRNLSRLEKIIHSFKPEVAHLHWYGLLFINQLAKLARTSNIPYIYTLHGAPVSAGKKWWMIQKVYNLYKKTRWKAILEHANDITAVSQYTIDHFSEFDAYKKKIRVVPNWVYSQDFQKKIDYNIYDQFSFPEQAKIYLSIGRIERIKWFDQFIRMIPGLLKSWIDVRYVIAWRDNWYKAELDKLIKELGIEDRVFYLGFISWDDKLSALQNADALIVPSHTESFGLVPLEGVSAGLLPIVNDIPAFRELVGSENAGIIIDFSNEKNAFQLQSLAVDSDRLVSTAEKYNWTAIAQEYLSYYL